MMGLPVAFSLIIASVGYLLISPDFTPLLIVPQRLAVGTNQFILLAIPFFLLAGEIMNEGGLMKRILNLSKSWVGHIPGGTGHANVLSSMLFSGISGSAVSDVSSMGKLEIEMMAQTGFKKDFSPALTAASATIGPIIPPSIPLILYGGLTGVSVGKLFFRRCDTGAHYGNIFNGGRLHHCQKNRSGENGPTNMEFAL